MRLLLSFMFVLSSVLLGISQEKYSEVKIDLRNQSIDELTKLGLETDHGTYTKGVHFINVFSERELAMIEENGFNFRILEEDATAAYLKRSREQVSKRAVDCGDDDGLFYDYVTPENYEPGSMGGYFTLQEMYNALDLMHEKYPHLIAKRDTIAGSTTWDGNMIYWTKISDNVDTDEEDEPEILYTALHHAREPNSLSQMIFYLWYLLENYETNDQVKYLVDHTEMYFIPCVNPDGYEFNEQNNPNGGGFWRKNRRENAPDTFGVDLNRNYGYFWGFDNQGSSSVTTSNVYRGPEAFSEPETQAVRDFSIAHNFQVAQNFHTHGNLLIHPWGFSDMPTDEDTVFKAMGNVMIKENSFVMGTGTETVGYIVNGDADDYLYGDEVEKNKIYAYTPEVGPRFWPDSVEIDQLNKSALWLNMASAHVTLNYYDHTIAGLESPKSELTGSLMMNVIKAGLKEGSATLNIIADEPSILSFENTTYSLDFQNFEQEDYILNYTIDASVSNNAILGFKVVTDNGVLVLEDYYTIDYDTRMFNPIYSNDFVDLSDLDTEDTSWGLTESAFVSAPTSLTDSPEGAYSANDISIVEMDVVFDLTNADDARLTFDTRYEIEANFDYCQVQASTGDDNWIPLCGRYTNAGVSDQGTFDPLYDGTQLDWVSESMSLTDFVGELVYIRFVMVSDQFIELDGFYVDNLNIEIIDTDVNVEEEQAKDAISIVPNIGNGLFDIIIDDEKSHDIAIFNVNGQLIQKMSITKSGSLDITNQPSGVYLIQVNMDGVLVNEKVTLIRE